MSDVTSIPVGGERPYQVLVGRDLLDELPGLLPGAAQAAVLHALPLREVADRAAATLDAVGVAPMLVEVPDAEAGKDIEVAADCWDRLGAAGFTRTDAVVGVGGGAVTDLAGFVAACWLRGVRAVQVPTSLLGMVDAAVGGKTGVNTAAGKNLVGAFHPPAGVLCDMSTLDTLPAVDLVAGLAEVVKCGFIADPAILDLVEEDPHRHLRELTERAVRVKARSCRRTCASRGRARSSTTGTRSGTPSSGTRGMRGGTGTRSRSGWSTPPHWAGCPGASTGRPPTGTAASCPGSACR